MEKNRHIIIIVSSIETGDVDQRASQAIAKILGVQCWLPVIREGYCLSVICRDLDVFVLGRERGMA